MWYPEAEHIIDYNVLVLETIRVKKADRAELRSRTKLQQVVEKCKELEGDVYEKAVVLLRGLVKAHAFASGNRRTAFLATKEFVLENGEPFNISDDSRNARVLQGVREDFYTTEELIGWIQTGEIREFRRPHSGRSA